MSHNDHRSAPICAQGMSPQANSNGHNNGPILPPPELFNCTELIPPPPEFNQNSVDDETNTRDSIIPPPKYFQSQPSDSQETGQATDALPVPTTPTSFPSTGNIRAVTVLVRNVPNLDSNMNKQPLLPNSLMATEQISPNVAGQVRLSGSGENILPNTSSFKSFTKNSVSTNCVQSRSASVMTQFDSILRSDTDKTSSPVVRKCISEEVINKSHSRVILKSRSDIIGDVLVHDDKLRKPKTTVRRHERSSDVQESTEHTAEFHQSLDNRFSGLLRRVPSKLNGVSGVAEPIFQREESTVTDTVESYASSETLTEGSNFEVENITNTTKALVEPIGTLPVGSQAVKVTLIIKHDLQNGSESDKNTQTVPDETKYCDIRHTSDTTQSTPHPASFTDDVKDVSDDDVLKCKHDDSARLTPRQMYFEDFGAAHRPDGDILNATENPANLRGGSPRSEQANSESFCKEDDDLADLKSLVGKIRADRLREEINKDSSVTSSSSQGKSQNDSMEVKEYKQESINLESEVREHIQLGQVENISQDICRQLFPKTKQNEFFFGREQIPTKSKNVEKQKRCTTASYYHRIEKDEKGYVSDERREDYTTESQGHEDEHLDVDERRPTEVAGRGKLGFTSAEVEDSKSKSRRGASEEFVKHSERKEEVIRIPRPLSFILPEMNRLSSRRSQENTLMRPCESSSFETNSSMNTSAPVSPVLNSRSFNSANEQPVGNAQSNEYLSGHSRQSSFDSHLSLSSSPMTSSVAPVQSHFVVVAIDFGTTYSGYAFSFTRDPESIHMMRRWEGGDPGIVNQKTPTTLLLQPDGSFHSFGFTARDFYHDLDAQEAKKWLYFEKFKMTLHHNAELSKDTVIKASNGKPYPALSVFSHALKFFKDHALQELSDQSSTTILNEDIRWVITVPAIWKAPAKQFMRQASYQAGIASIDSASQLLIALEPEAASIYVRKLRLYQLVPESTGSTDFLRQQSPQPSYRRQREATPDSLGTSSQYLEGEETLDDSVKYQTLPAAHFNETVYPTSTSATVGHQVDKAGTRYMVVDCGGGTVDITVYEMESKYGQLKELHKATGGPFGSLGVDMEFEHMLVGIFGAEFMDAFKLKRPAGWVDLMTAFESRKRTASPFKNNSLNVSLPFSFIDYYKKCKGSHVEAAIRKYGNRDVCWSSQGMLRLTTDAMRRLFQPTLDHIKQAVGDVLNSPNAKDIQFLFLVGGFSESPILQLEMRREFGHLLRIIIPQDVGLTILKGAVCFGLDPTIVCVRRSRLTYGVGVLNRFVHGRHPPSKLVRKQDVDWCMDVFDKYVEVDQSVALGDTVIRSYTPAKLGQKSSIIHIYCTDKQKVDFITEPGVKKCGTLCLDLTDVQYQQQPPGGANKRREIHTRMTFGDTEIKVMALDVSTGKCVRSGIDFLNK